MKVVVTGSRNQFKESFGGKALISKLMALWPKITVLATGECYAGGADLVAKQWARRMNTKYEAFPVNTFEWACGKFGGHMRNGRMLRKFKPDLVIAVKEWAGNGTRNCVAQAEAMGIKVEWV